jgi:hypothetical protein
MKFILLITPLFVKEKFDKSKLDYFFLYNPAVKQAMYIAILGCVQYTPVKEKGLGARG